MSYGIKFSLWHWLSPMPLYLSPVTDCPLIWTVMRGQYGFILQCLTLFCNIFINNKISHTVLQTRLQNYLWWREEVDRVHQLTEGMGGKQMRLHGFHPAYWVSSYNSRKLFSWESWVHRELGSGRTWGGAKRLEKCPIR